MHTMPKELYKYMKTKISLFKPKNSPLEYAALWIAGLFVVLAGLTMLAPAPSYAQGTPDGSVPVTGNNDTDADTTNNGAKKGRQCGKGKDSKVVTRFNFGCLGETYDGAELNPITDLAFALVRFLSTGVGIIIVGSIILAGIQYSASEGNPEATQAAKGRIQSAVVGLFIYLFAFAFIQYLVPGGLFS